MDKTIWEKLISGKMELLRVAAPVHQPGETVEYCTDFWSINIYDYTAELTLNGHRRLIQPGECCIMPPGTRRQFNFLAESPHRYAHFLLPVTEKQEAVVVNMGPKAKVILQLFDDVMNTFPLNRQRASVAFSYLLWELSDCFDPIEIGKEIHPAVKLSLQLIEQQLPYQLTVNWLVKQVHISHNQLTRLFKSQFNCTITAYIRKRRASIAKHLLLQTEQPIKEIAIEVGLFDLQIFNKTIRKEFGISPRALRLERSNK